MKIRSYKIKHDFLFDADDTSINLSKLKSNFPKNKKLKLSDVLKAKDEKSFMRLLNVSNPVIVIEDDIGKCTSPASERYKQFIVRCVCQKLLKHNFTIYL